MQSNQCITCAHFRPNGGRALTCTAFEHIPAAILTGRHDHSLAFEGDVGTRYERNPALPAPAEIITMIVESTGGQDGK